MTARIAANYLNNAARTNAQQKQGMEDLNANLKEALGGDVETELTIAAGAVTATTGIHNIDTEANAATDDLTLINQTNHPDSRLLLLRSNNSARAVVVKHGAGGTGQILLAEAADLTLNDTTMWLLLIRSGTNWTEVLRGYGNTTRKVPKPVTADVEKLLEATSNGYQLVAPRVRRNAVINGGCQVGQRAAPNLSTSYQYGKTDRLACKADGTVGAGTINQAETALLGRTGFASHLAGVTLTGAGAVYWRTRLESADVQHLINQAGMVSLHAYHDIGSAKNFTITVNRANAKDDFSAVTLVSASGNLSVATATAAPLIFAIATMGACGNGVEIIVKCDSGAITTKNIYLTELQLEQSKLATEFERQAVSDVLARCQRYYAKSHSLTDPPGAASASWAFRLPGNVAASGGLLRVHVPFVGDMRVPPAITLYGDNGASGVLTVNGSNRSASTSLVRTTGFSTITNDSLTLWNDGEGLLGSYIADAEF